MQNSTNSSTVEKSQMNSMTQAAEDSTPKLKRAMTELSQRTLEAMNVSARARKNYN